MTTGDDRVDELLRAAYAAGIAEPESEDSAGPASVPLELNRRVLAETRTTSSRLLVNRILTHAKELGVSTDDLAREAGRFEPQAGTFLEQGGDPTQVPAHALARLLWRAGVDPTRWRDLLRQAATSFAGAVGPHRGVVAYGRSTGLSATDRAEALASRNETRDRSSAIRAGESYVHEVEQAWTALTTGSTTTEPN